MMQRNSDYAKSLPDFIFLPNEDSAVFVFCLFGFFGRLGPCYVALVGAQLRNPPFISFCYTCCLGGLVQSLPLKRNQSPQDNRVRLRNLLTPVENEKE